MTLSPGLHRKLVVAATLLLVQQAIATFYAIALRLPYEVGGVGRRETVLRDSLSRGTALSAPVTVLVVFALMVLLATYQGKVGRIGAAGLGVLSVVFLVAGAMEPLLRRTLSSGLMGPAELGLICLSVSGSLMAAIVLALGFMNAVAPPREA